MKLVELIDKAEKFLISILFTIMVLTVFAQVINRNIVKMEISWFEEVSRCCMVYIVMFAAEMGLRDHTQLNIDSLTRRLPAKTANVFRWISDSITVIFSVVVCATSFRILETQISSGAVTAGLGMPTWIPQASVTIGSLLITLTQIIVMVSTLLKHQNRGETV